MIVNSIKQDYRCKMRRKINKILNMTTIYTTEEWIFLELRSNRPKNKDNWRNKKHLKNIRKQMSLTMTYKLKQISLWQSSHSKAKLKLPQVTLESLLVTKKNLRQ